MAAAQTEQKGFRGFAILGLLCALIAFALSMSAPWVKDNYEQSPSALENKFVDTAKKLASRLRGTGVEVKISRARHWSEYWPLGVIVLSVIGAALGVFGFVNRENSRMSFMAMAIGLCSVGLLYYPYIIMVVIAFLIIGIILSNFDLSI